MKNKLKESEERKYVFICGLHRSGTSVLHRILRGANETSGFKDLGVSQDEGQGIQTVYSPAKAFGGPGKFAFAKQSRLTEDSPLITLENQSKLFQEWSPHWDLSKPILLEKSPPNILKTRFLQQMFPNSYFITVIRHPLAVSYATKKWSNTSILNLLKHWTLAHNLYFEDRNYLRNEMMLSYEEMTKNPEKTFNKISTFLGVKISISEKLVNHNDRYFNKWNQLSWRNIKSNAKKELAILSMDKKVKKFGYSLKNLDVYPTYIDSIDFDQMERIK